MNLRTTEVTSLIQGISEYLASDLARVEEHIQDVLNSDTALTREVGTYVFAGRGKKLRPILAILSSRAFDYTGSSHTSIAAALEMVHTATLLHDDVIDKATIRRGRPTVNAKWGDDVAILIADYLYSNAFKLALKALSPQLLTILCDVTARMCEGEMFQIEKRNALLSRDDYLRIVTHKTAYLFSACTGLGTMLAGASTAETALLTSYGLNFGIAFQITDDTLDLVSNDQDIGKQAWSDIRNGKQTLPFIHTMEVADAADRNDLLHCWNNGRDSERILRHIHKYNGIEYSLEVAQQYADAAKQQLAPIRGSEALERIVQLSDYVVQRTF